MQRYMYKRNLFYAAFILLFLIGGCGTSSGVDDDQAVLDDEQEELAAGHLLTVWSDHLQVQENMYASTLWALDHIEKYLDTGGWDDLSKARTACIASARYLSDLSMTEEDLSDEEYAVLAKSGVDTTFQSVEFDAVPSRIQDEHSFVRDLMLEMLEEGIFISKNIEFLKEDISLHKEFITYWSQNECLTTNYLLLTLGGGETEISYWEAMPERYPVLCTGYSQWEKDKSALESSAERCLDQVEGATLRQADLLAAMEANLYSMKKAAEDNDEEKWIASAFVMNGVPELLPIPAWYDPQTAKYLSFIHEEDGDILYPGSGDELKEAPYGVYMQLEGVSAQEIADYIAEIQGVAQRIKKNPYSDTWDIAMKEYHVQFSLENETATIIFEGQDVTFAPEWYLGV